MGTPHAQNKRDQQVNVRLTDAGVAKIDEMRGSWSKSEYIRQAVAFAVKNGKRGPEPVEELEDPSW